MATISDTIEQFILSVIGEEDSIRLSRNELANYFCVAPSQINYVLATRFNLDKGYVVESKRGGGGFVTLVRVHTHGHELISHLLQELDTGGDLTYPRACNLIDRLAGQGLVTDSEGELLKAALSDKALATPSPAPGLRKNIFREILIGLYRRG